MSKEMAFEREASKFLDNKTASEITLAIARLSKTIDKLEIKVQMLEDEIKDLINDKHRV